MTKIFDRKAPVPGAKYRVLPWHDIYAKNPGTPIGYGLEERLRGTNRYKAVAWCGDIHPWPTKAVAVAAVQVINQCSGGHIPKEKASGASKRDRQSRV